MNHNTEARKCPQCQATIPPESPGGVCPKCLLAAAGKTALDPGAPHFDGIPTLAELKPLFPQLELIDFVGRGGMGCVFKARQPQLDRMVALKLLPRELGADPHFSERFNREARVLAKLSHPNIVGVYDFGMAAGFHYLLMEFVDGLNLRQAMQAGRFSPAEALAIVPRICEALQFAHEHGVLHRDIKPENILLDAKGRVKIADFGIAKLVGEEQPPVTLTVAGTALGSPHYMSPEQLEKPEQVDHRTDIYSLGVVFYEMLTGELPIGRFSPPSERVTLDQRVDEIVMRALAREKELRQESANQVKTEVEHVTSTRVIRKSRAARSWSWVAVLAAVIVTALVLRNALRSPASVPQPTNAVAPKLRDPAKDQANIDETLRILRDTEKKAQAGEANEHDLAKARHMVKGAEARGDAVLQAKAYLSYAEELLAIARKRNVPKEIGSAEYDIIKARFAVAAAEAKGDKIAVAAAQADAARETLELTRRHFREGLVDEVRVRSAERDLEGAVQYLGTLREKARALK